MEYLNGLPNSEPSVRVPFEKGRAAMAAYKWDEAIGHFEESRKHAAGTELVALHGLIGRCHHTPGRLQQALESFEESARLASLFKDKQGLAHALDNVGVVLRDQGKFDRALDKYEEALRLAHEAGALPEQGSALNHIGGFYFVSGEPAKALRYYEDALVIHLETGDRKEQAMVLCNIGITLPCLEKGDQGKGLEYCEKALALAREIGAKKLEAAALGNIGYLRSDNAAPGERLEFHERALKLFREIGDKLGETAMLANIGGILRERGEYEKAVGLYLTAQATCSVPGTLVGPERYRHGLGKCLDALGREKFVAACEKAGMPKPEAEKLAKQLASSAGKI
jgi:tetratricopeptide (TPR) repeat protein